MRNYNVHQLSDAHYMENFVILIARHVRISSRLKRVKRKITPNFLKESESLFLIFKSKGKEFENNLVGISVSIDRL